MTESDLKKAELKSLLVEAKGPAPTTPRRTPRKKPGPKAGNTIIVNGNGVAAHQIAGGDIHNHTHAKPPPRPKIVVTPGEGVITDAQKAELTAARAEWLALHGSIKKSPLSEAAAWMRINKAAKATSYHLITPENFPLALAYIKEQMAILRNMASAPSKDDNWRKSRISAIKARCKNQLGDQNGYKSYIEKNFKAASLTDLSTDQLRKTYVYIMAKKTPARPVVAP